MKNRILLICLSAFFIGSGVVFVSNHNAIQSQSNYISRTKQLNRNDFNGAREYLKLLRNNQITGEIDPVDLVNAQKGSDVLNNSGSKSLNLQWEEMGPNNIGGRTRAILIDMNNSNIVYAGGVAGGLWKSTTGGSSWAKVNDTIENLAISCITQTPNGDIYFGTGEGLGVIGANPNGGTSFIGRGIFKSTDGGNTFSQIGSTNPTNGNSSTVEWAIVNELAADPNNGRVYAATNKGLRMSADGGATWINPIYTSGTNHNVSNSTDVDVASDGTVVACVGNKCYISPNGDDASFVNQSGSGSTDLPASGVSRIEIAIAPSNPNYMYCSAAAADGKLKNIYRSTDKGETWSIIGPGGSGVFQPLGNQGSYDNTIAVFPNNPDKIIVGGLDMWQWELGGTWTQKTIWFLGTYNPKYVHADHHEYVFQKNNANILYVGSDGGISKSVDGGENFQTMNTNYNVTQFYSVAPTGWGAVLGGTQDNGTLFIHHLYSGNQYLNAARIMGGDGGWCASSNINRSVFFGTVYYGDMGRSANLGDTWSGFINSRMSAAGIGTTGAAFVTPLLLWESTNDIYSNDYIAYSDSLSHNAGTVLSINSASNSYPFSYTLPTSYTAFDTIYIQDIVQSKFFLGASGAVWMTREPLDFSKTPDWIKIATVSGTVQTMAYSKDGNYLFVGTGTGNLYRISNILFAYDSLSADVTSPNCVVETKLLSGLPGGGRPITSIAVDPSDAEHIIVTLGSYGNTTYIYRSTNALDQTPTFASKQGTLPAMPIYSSLIEMNNPNNVIIGTEYGIFSTGTINTTPNWTADNQGMANVPVYMIRQQTNNFPYLSSNFPGTSNLGEIYIGTHGRGIYKCSKYVGINEIKPNAGSPLSNLHVFPNPVIDNTTVSFVLANKENVTIRIYDLSGKLVQTFKYNEMASGLHQLQINLSDLRKGTYLVQLISGNKSTSAKILKN